MFRLRRLRCTVWLRCLCLEFIETGFTKVFCNGEVGVFIDDLLRVILELCECDIGGVSIEIRALGDW